MTINAAVIMFKESNAFKISSKINPKARDAEEKILLNRILQVNVKARYKERKKMAIWVKLAWARLSG